MAQLTYLQNAAASFPGMPLDTGPHDDLPYRNDEVVDVPVGLAVMQEAGVDQGFKMPNALGALLIGVLINSMFRTPGYPGAGSEGNALGIIPGDMANVRRKGRVAVTVEEAVTPASSVYVRIAASVNTPALVQLGSFRASPDGVAQVTTLTPTAANATLYVVRVEVTLADGKTVRAFEFIEESSGAATAATIVTQFKAAMAEDAEFTALVVASGANTLILTGQNEGQPFVVSSDGDGVIAVAATTPPAATAMLWKGQQYLTSAAAAGISALEVDIAAGRA